MTTYIVDNSMWSKAGSSPAVGTRLRRAMTRDVILVCPPQALEYCFSARNAAEHDHLRNGLSEFVPVDRHPGEDDVLDIQRALWAGGYVRSAGTVDVMTAAYARKNDATVLTADRDFEHIAAVVPGFRCEYVPEE